MGTVTHMAAAPPRAGGAKMARHILAVKRWPLSAPEFAILSKRKRFVLARITATEIQRSFRSEFFRMGSDMSARETMSVA